MKEDKTYPRLRNVKPNFKKSRELRKQMRYNTTENNKKIKFFTMLETRDTYLVQNILRLKEIKL